MAPRGPLTPTALAGHLACPHLTQLDRRRRAGEAIPLVKDPGLEALFARGLEHEAAFVARLSGEGRTVCDLRASRDVAATHAAMRAGHAVIVQAPLADGAFTGIADVLLRVEEPSALGAWSYQPADTKLACETKAGTILQLCTYCELLTPLQGTTPHAFRVITPRAEERYKTADFAAYFRVVRARLAQAVAIAPPPNTYPDPVPHCDVCGYRRHCADQRRADDHPSLIAGVRTTQVREMQRQGIATLTSLATCEGALPEPPRRGRAETFVQLGRQAKLQVAARALQIPPVEILPVEAERGLARLPAPSPGDVFLDFEGDPFVGDPRLASQGLEYLTGWCVRDGDGGLRYEERWALDGAEEKAACEAFLDEVQARLARDPDLHVFHFGGYEPAALKRLCARHATRGDVLDALLRGRRFVDLHAVVREGLRVGVERYGLKELEVLHGYSRSLDLRDAGRARRDFELKLELGLGRTADPDLCARIGIYNREDCESTASLRAWLEAQRDALVAAGTPVPRPVPGATEPSEAVGARDQRIADLQSALRADLPADPTQHDAEQGARALLASMLGYFRQEEKNAWWEHFRLRELPPDERRDEREMLAGLEFVEVLPKVGKQRHPRHRFRFPPQDTAIDVGDTVYYTADEDPAGRDGSTSVTVDGLDLGARTVDLTLGRTTAAQPPRSVFKKQVFGATRIESALLAFADDVLAHGLADDTRLPAARALLLRRPPRRRTGEGPLHHPTESSLDAARRLCADLDRGLLAIQGPPGTGKTYTGARAIVALAKAGKTVGVTAVSHKVIDNLLVAVRAAAAEAGVLLRLVHKDEAETAGGIEYFDSGQMALDAITPGTIVGGTAWLWAGDDAADRLDYLFIDEAGQMALAQALAVSRAARNLILLGDPQQLDQPTRGAHEGGADVAALVHVLGREQATLRPDQGLFLEQTFRLHRSLCAFTSPLYYDGRLVPHDDDATHRRLHGGPFEGAGPFLVEVDHADNQASAEVEVDAVEAIVQALLRSDTQWADKRGARRPLTPHDILVIAPYNAQVGLLRRRLAAHGVTAVGTVDRFQGQEAPVVVYSCTSSSPQDAPRGMDFLYDPHRFNVATSRAEGAVIVVASPALFVPECRTPAQMRKANGLCRYRELAQLVPLTALA